VDAGRPGPGGPPGRAEVGEGEVAHPAIFPVPAQVSAPRATESVECAGSPSSGSRETSTVP
jgi:hypothetical protein